MFVIDSDNYKKEDGFTDWSAYHAAEEGVGERCHNCHESIVALKPPMMRTLCYSCRALREDSGGVSSDRLIRCPRCGEQMDAESFDLWEGTLQSEGDHEVDCIKCENRFEIYTNISFSFDSPPMIVKDKQC